MALNNTQRSFPQDFTKSNSSISDSLQNLLDNSLISQTTGDEGQLLLSNLDINKGPGNNTTLFQSKYINGNSPAFEILQTDDVCIYSCLLCYDQFCTSEELEEHLNSHFENGDLTIKAEIIQEQPSDLQNDTSTITTEDFDDDFVKTETLSEFETTSKVCNDDIFLCRICDFLTSSQENLTNHINTHCDNDFASSVKTEVATTDHNLYQCMFCEFSSQRQADLNKHIETHSGEEHCTEIQAPMLNCIVCYKKFHNSEQLNAHIKYHEADEINYKCLTCSFVTKYKSVLSKHIIAHITERYAKRVTDEEVFSLIKHFERAVTLLDFNVDDVSYDFEKRVYKCNTCNYSSSLKDDVAIHYKNVHLSKARIQCEECSQIFRSNILLASHMRHHKIEAAEFKCFKCIFTTGQKIVLERHMNIHFKQKVRNELQSNIILLDENVDLLSTFDNEDLCEESDTLVDSTPSEDSNRDVQPPDVVPFIDHNKTSSELDNFSFFTVIEGDQVRAVVQEDNNKENVSESDDDNRDPLDSIDYVDASESDTDNVINNSRNEKCESLNLASDKCNESLLPCDKPVLATDESQKPAKYQCTDCVYLTPSLDELQKHCKIVHNVDLQCNVCKKIFSNKASLLNHLATHLHNIIDLPGDVRVYEKDLKCKVCHKVFADEMSLSKHSHVNNDTTIISSEDDDDELECTKCEYSADSKRDLQKHISKSHTRSLVCIFCHRAFRHKGAFIAHTKTHTKMKLSNNSSTTKCNFCGKSFSSEIEIYTHIVITHKHIIESYTTKTPSNPAPILPVVPQKSTLCTLCGVNFDTQTSLLEHLLRSHNSTDIQLASEMRKFIQTLPQIFKDQSTSTIISNSNTFKVLECFFCKKHFDSEFQLHNHMFVVHKKKVDETFKSSTALKSAPKKQPVVFINSILKPSTCNICGKRYNNESVLHQHMLASHMAPGTQINKSSSNTPKLITVSKTQSSNFCRVCGACFETKTLLFIHTLLLHDKVDMDIISLSLKKRSSTMLTPVLESLLAVSSNVMKAITCIVCGKRFDSESSLLLHLDLLHSKRHPEIIKSYFESCKPASQLQPTASNQSTNTKKCIFCEEGFPDYFSVILHITQAHRVSNAKIVKLYATTSQLQATASKQSANNNLCIFCGNRIDDNFNLLRHIIDVHRVVNEEIAKSFSTMQDCPSTSTTPVSLLLQKHVSINSNEKLPTSNIEGNKGNEEPILIDSSDDEGSNKTPQPPPAKNNTKETQQPLSTNNNNNWLQMQNVTFLVDSINRKAILIPKSVNKIIHISKTASDINSSIPIIDITDDGDADHVTTNDSVVTENSHSNSTLSTKNQNFACKVCSKTFDDINCLQEHMKSHKESTVHINIEAILKGHIGEKVTVFGKTPDATKNLNDNPILLEDGNLNLGSIPESSNEKSICLKTTDISQQPENGNETLGSNKSLDTGTDDCTNKTNEVPVSNNNNQLVVEEHLLQSHNKNELGQKTDESVVSLDQLDKTLICVICEKVLHSNVFEDHMKKHFNDFLEKSKTNSQLQKIMEDKLCKKVPDVNSTMVDNTIDPTTPENGINKDNSELEMAVNLVTLLTTEESDHKKNECVLDESMNVLSSDYSSESHKGIVDAQSPLCEKNEVTTSGDKIVAMTTNTQQKELIREQEIIHIPSDTDDVHSESDTKYEPDEKKKPDCVSSLHKEVVNVSNQHISHNEFDAYPYKCNECPFACTSLTNLSCHKRNVHSSYVCDICNKKYLYIHTLQAHVAMYHTDVVFQSCSECEFYTLYEEAFKMHMQNHNKTKYNMTAKDEKELESTCNRQMQSVNNTQSPPDNKQVANNQHKCSTCDIIFTTFKGLSIHERLVHSRCQQKRFCKVCKGEFTSTLALKQHMESHSNISKCFHCSFKTPHKKRLETHMQEHIIKREVKEEPQCTTGKNNFFKLCKKLSNIDTVTDKKTESLSKADQEMQDNFCENEKQEKQQNINMPEVEQEKSCEIDSLFACTKCSFNTISNKNLLEHIKSEHCNEKHVCSTCNNKFPTVGALRKHMKTHFFNCIVCMFFTNDRNKLDKHMTDFHLNNKPETRSISNHRVLNTQIVDTESIEELIAPSIVYKSMLHTSRISPRKYKLRSGKLLSSPNRAKRKLIGTLTKTTVTDLKQLSSNKHTSKSLFKNKSSPKKQKLRRSFTLRTNNAHLSDSSVKPSEPNASNNEKENIPNASVGNQNSILDYDEELIPVCKIFKTGDTNKRERSRNEDISKNLDEATLPEVSKIKENETDKKLLKRLCCIHCNFKTVSKTMLNIHIQLHSGKLTRLCTLCNYKTDNKTDLHFQVHKDSCIFICKLCKYSTRFKYKMKLHIIAHTGERPHSCKLCNYQASSKRLLYLHLYAHIIRQKFKCKFCSYRCKQKLGLLYHIKCYH